MRIEELKQREVINISDGKRLGFISDLEIEDGAVTAAILPYSKGFSLFGQGDEYTIPWGSIIRLGDDTILVDYEIPPEPLKRKKERGKRQKA